MVVKRNMMFSRGINCRYCAHGYYGMQPAVDYAIQKDSWNVRDIQKEDAWKDPIYAAVEEHNPFSIFHFGHGSNCVTTGDREQPIWSNYFCDNLKDRVVYFFSCLTANCLGPAIIQAGGRAYAGFNVSWTWMSASGTDGDPYEDRYAKAFFESAVILWIALLDCHTFAEAIQISIDKYTEWIDYFTNVKPNSQAVKWLIHDRDSLTGLGDLDVKLCVCEGTDNKEECLANGCFWYDGACHTELPEVCADEKRITIDVPPAEVTISNVEYPEEVMEGFGAVINYSVNNTSGKETIWGAIIDTDTNEMVQNSYWEHDIKFQETYDVEFITTPISKDMNLRIEIGRL